MTSTDTPFNKAYPIITEAFNNYRQMSDQAREIYRKSLPAKVQKLPSRLWWTVFQSDPQARSVIARTQGDMEVRAAVRRLAKSWASGKPVDQLMLAFSLESDARSACRQTAGLFAEWDLDRLDGWLSVLDTRFPGFGISLRAAAETDSQARRKALDAPYMPTDQVVQWTARVPARFLVSYADTPDDEDEPVFTDGTNYPQDGLQRLEDEYRGFFLGRETALDTSSETAAASIVHAAIHWSEGIWNFDFWVVGAGAIPAQDIERSLLEYLAAQLSDGWGEDLTRYERLVGSEVWMPHFDADPATWVYGFTQAG
ncbi:hypothetical protein [Acidithiobacillus thiooxidans]|uniref:hypothetical protein n=1 Tax=Acidithiobacillus thiooxidans TaxID=930 RepID=UPI0004E14987|nr:hypothetical protein [Acidithiobacillus thiooxidans]